jgi:hypothetical protein
MNVNTAFIANMSLKVFNDTNGISKVNTSGTSLEEFQKMIIDVELWVKGVRQTEFTRFIKVPINTCEIKRFKSNVLVKIFIDSLERHSNLQLSCPQKRGTYYAYNFEVSDENLPLIFASGDWYVTALVKGAIEKKKGLKNIISITMHGSYIHK